MPVLVTLHAGAVRDEMCFTCKTLGFLVAFKGLASALYLWFVYFVLVYCQ